MIAWIKARLVADAKDWWRWSSVRFAALGGAIASWAASDPAGFAQATHFLPEWARPLIGIALAAAAVGLRLTKSKEA